jgi:hypothetical protein
MHSKLEETEARSVLDFRVLTEEDLVQWTVIIEPEDEEDSYTHVDKLQLTTKVLSRKISRLQMTQWFL